MRKVLVGNYQLFDNNRAKQVGYSMEYLSNIDDLLIKHDLYLDYAPDNVFNVVDMLDCSQISNDNHLLNCFSKESLEKLKECDDEYLKAAVIVRKLFKDKTDKAGAPYINHLISVSDGVDQNDYIAKVAGLLHDTVEDTDVTCIDLLEVKFPREVVEAVFIVTKPIFSSQLSKEQRLKLYNDEIDSIIASNNNSALKIKISDISNNYNPERLAKHSEDKQEWFREKYGKQLIKLKKERERRNI